MNDEIERKVEKVAKLYRLLCVAVKDDECLNDVLDRHIKLLQQTILVFARLWG